MNTSDIARAIDIHYFLDRLEEKGTPQDYYRINHLSSEQRKSIAFHIAEAMVPELKALGLSIEAN